MLRCRQVDLRLAVALEAAHADVAHHADDGSHREGDGELLTDRVAAGKLLARKGLADHRHAWRVERITEADVATLQ